MSRVMHIRFIRHNEKCARNDDTMKLVSSDGLTFKATFTSGETRTSTNATMTDCGVFRWIRSVIGLLHMDADPYQFIQLDLPLMPSVLLKVKNLDDLYNRVLNAIEVHLDNWPAKKPAASRSSLLNTAGIAERSDDEVVEDPYSDMPPLIPLTPTTSYPVRTHHYFLD